MCRMCLHALSPLHCVTFQADASLTLLLSLLLLLLSLLLLSLLLLLLLLWLLLLLLSLCLSLCFLYEFFLLNQASPFPAVPCT